MNQHRTYYNEIDPYAVAWLRNLITDGLISPGEVDDRSIKDVRPNDLKGFTRAHWFAGIAGWDLALRLSDWPTDRPVWTGSCPCQPFSVAGKQKGFEDDRDLWPIWFNLIRECRPVEVFGEQVASAVEWRARMHRDMERAGYAVGSKPIQAASAGACQLRDRLWFVAHCDLERTADRPVQRSGEQRWSGADEGDHGGDVAGQSRIPQRESQHGVSTQSWEGARVDGGWFGARHDAGGTGCGGLNLAGQRRTRLEERASLPGHDGAQLAPVERSGGGNVVGSPRDRRGEGWTESEFRRRGFTAACASITDQHGVVWQFIQCPDGKFRRLPPPRVRWLGNAIPARTSKLRAYGNAIVPQVAAEFIGAYLDCAPTYTPYTTERI